ncbi:MAG: (d)CMP kinase [Thermoplasmata archaeon]
MIVVIGGPPGSGKTTVAERWAAARGYVLVSAGTKFRAMARERGRTLEELGRAAEKDPSIDRALDAAVLKEIRAKQAAGVDVVVDGRIQAYLLSRQRIPCLKVLIDAPLEMRAQRIAQREKTKVADAKREILAREASERVRYKAIYGIDLQDTSVFDLVIDSRDKTPDETVSLIATRVRG